jgi:hypothetical protein
MPAKFVNLIEFFEFEIFSQIEAVRMGLRGIDDDRIVLGFNVFDLCPDQR